MPESRTTRKSSATQKSSHTKKRTASRKGRSKAKKPKVALARNKVILLSGIISVICVCALALNILLNTSAEISSEKKIQEIQKTAEIAKTMPAEGEKELPKPAIKHETKTVAGKETVSVKPAAAKQASEKQASPAKQAPAKQVSPAKQSSPAKQASPVRQESKSSQIQKSVQAEKKTPVQTQKPAVQSQPVKKAESVKTSSNQNSQIASVTPPKEQEQIQQNVPRNRFAIPQASNGATVVIIIDDAGRSVENTKRYASLPFPITIAVLPKLPQSRACADAIRAAGKEVILHQPMQSMNLNLDPGPGKITADMSTYEIAAIVKQNLLELGPGVKGMNNHEGSQVTSNVIKIGTVLDVCSEMGVYFLDSRTTAATQAPQAALERDMHIFEKAGPYLDNDIDRAKMLERMRETLAYANRHGRAIVIGHVDKSVKILPDLLSEMYPEMKAAGYRFATPSMLR
ncbi:MAG: divergent polysaccharide deacetylase family protein [Treponema sp.]|uniref:divergent polysaccharide deacetylase family protein n=1 Tax=Treponema sp. TaxID=166 RepID=UPI0025DC59DC|nr:divergent polysaccharide deacetylase family protein [Treponema sp.]MBQ9282167.1 divergent polysaccharide deacetylase family protein [Treponema sp.]